jgi:hypothetical protein
MPASGSSISRGVVTAPTDDSSWATHADCVELRTRTARTVSFHRPLADYVNRLAKAGLTVDAMREIAVPRWDGDRARFVEGGTPEIPLFLGLRAVKRGGAP